MTAQQAITEPLRPAEVSRQRKDALREILSVLPSATFSAAGICYALGLLIVNIYLNRYGVYAVELVRSDFVLVGAVFLFLVALATTSAERGRHVFPQFPAAWKEKKLKTRLWRVTSLTARFLFAFLIVPAVALVTLSRNTFGFHQWQIWASTLLLTVTGAHAADLFRRAVQFVREALSPADGEAGASGLMNQAYFALDVVLSLCMSIGSYALFAYPYLAPAFGGAHRDLVLLAPTTEGTAVAKHLNMPINANGDIGPVKLLSDNEIELTIVAGDDSSYEAKAIRIRREYISAIVAIAQPKEPPTKRPADAPPTKSAPSANPVSPRSPAPTTSSSASN
jgi:hypothetical protein